MVKPNSIKKINALRKLFLYLQTHLDVIDDPELVQVFKQKAYHYIQYCFDCLSKNTYTIREVAKIKTAMLVFRQVYLAISPEPLVDVGEDYCDYEQSDSEDEPVINEFQWHYPEEPEEAYTYELHKSQ